MLTGINPKSREWGYTTERGTVVERLESGWHLREHPELAALSEFDQQRVSYRKLLADLKLAIQAEVWETFVVGGGGCLLLGALSAAAAGSLWRRYGFWGALAGYLERTLPLVVALYAGLGVLWAPLWEGHLLSSLATFAAYGQAVALLLAATLAVVGAFREWKWPVRALLHATWVGLLLAGIFMAVPGKP
jgi:hypothetical protein